MNVLSQRPSGRQHVHGAAALAITLLLFFVMALVATFVNRNLIFEQRISANQYRSTQAFEAAEAGLQWAEAQLNGNQRLDDACIPTATGASAGDSFRERYLEWLPASGRLAPRTWNRGSNPSAALQPACVRGAAGWSCSCPAHGDAALPTPVGDGPFPAFRLEFVAGAKPGIVRVVATGCSSLAPPCLPGSAPRADASARVEVALGLLGGLRLLPAASLTTGGAVDADSAAFSARNPDPATGIAIHAGAAIAASSANLSGAPGAPADASQVEHDATLAGLATPGSERFFASYFGIGKARWRDQPAVTRVVCSVDCAAALAQAIADRASSAMLWVDGDLDVQGPASFGTPARPVVIVVDGAIRLHGAVAIDGVLYAGSVRWDDAASGAEVRGALLSESSYRGNSAPDFFYDPTVLAALTGFAGSFARVSGSWRDF